MTKYQNVEQPVTGSNAKRLSTVTAGKNIGCNVSFDGYLL